MFPTDDHGPGVWDEGPYVCPGCYAIGEAPCSPGCTDADMERQREYDQETRDVRR